MKELVKKLKTLLKKNENAVDIVIFGSFVKDKINTNDIDVALLCKSKGNINKTETKKEIEALIKAKIDLQIIDINDYDNFIWISLIREGFSVKHNNYLHELYKIKPVVLYKYSLKKISVSKKVMFERAIKNFEGIERISNRVILVPINTSEKFNEFLRLWNIDLDSREYGLLPLVRKEEFV